MDYPFDVVSYVRQKTFSVEARFSEEKEESPLKVFSDFSRYVFTVIQDGKAATTNIHIDDLPGMIAKSEYAFSRYMDSIYGEIAGETENLSPGFTVRFNVGTLKGKTPVEVLKENGEKGREILNNQYKWYKDNLSKFPDNKKYMDAIRDAGKLDPEAIASFNKGNSSRPITILEISTRPLVRKKRADGKCFCYECKVMFDSSKKYPVNVQIENYYAPVVVKENGLLNVVLKEKDNNTKVLNSFDMSAEEWLNTLDEMRAIRDDFRVLRRNAAFQLANDGDRKNREAASKDKKAG